MMRVRKRYIIHDLQGHDPLSYDQSCRVNRYRIRLPKKEKLEEVVEQGGR